MIKNHIFLLLLSCIFFNLNGNTLHQIEEYTDNKQSINCPDSLLGINGYYIKCFEKKNILLNDKARKNRLNNKPFNVPIDSHVFNDFFIPLKDSMLKDEEVVNEIKMCIKAKNDKEIFLYCTNANYSRFISQFCDEHNLVKRTVCKGFSSSKYYIIDTSDRYCYQVFYISGEWLKGVAVTESQKKIFSKNKRYRKIPNKDMPVYLLSKEKEVRELQIDGLKLWKNSPGIFGN